MTKPIKWISILTITLLLITTISGILSLNFNNGYEIINQYGDPVKIYGSGVYANDSYFKAVIAIGTDICILLVLLPLLIVSYIKLSAISSNINKLKMMSTYTVALYYSTSISFGLKYNYLHLVYIFLFTCSLLGLFFIRREMNINSFKYNYSKGIRNFLIFSGIALIVAWMPDIVPTIINGSHLPLIEVYTTEITYVLDMGIIAPLCFLCLILLKKADPLGVVILANLLKLCIVIGIMMIPQTVCQLLAGIDLPLPVIITKSVSFIILGGFAYYFNKKLYQAL